MASLQRELSPQEELAKLQSDLETALVERAIVEEKFRSRRDVVVTRSPQDIRILGLRIRMKQLEYEINPPPQLYNPRRRAKKL